METSVIEKSKLITKILSVNPLTVWEIDKSKYYGFIGFDGFETWWLKYALEKQSIEFLNEFIVELENN